MSDQAAPSDSRPFGLSWRWLVTIATAITLLATFGFAAYRWTESTARSNTDIAAEQLARSHVGLLSSELQKFRLLPLVLTEYPDARTVLSGGSEAAVARMNGKLELLAERTDAAVIYLIAPSGKTIAASNWRLPTSFVGQDYAFRPYFRDAMARGAAELFALGTISGRPGLFIARRIGDAARPIGVIVVKVEFDRIEADWARNSAPTFVTDEHGVVIITNRPEWRFQTVAPIAPAVRAQIRSAVQFGKLPLNPLPLRRERGVVSEGPIYYREATQSAPMPGAQLHVLQSLQPARANAAATTRTIGLVLLLLFGALLAWFVRAREKRRMEVESRQLLEFEVAARTAELDETNRSYRAAREELAQASRLGSIGQITAGVAHEVNQPVAAIRSFAENAGQFLDRGDTATVRSNLDTIVELTERIGSITAELRSFARKGTPVIGKVEVARVLDGALMLVGDRIRAGHVAIERKGTEKEVYVIADRVRLEQIIVNLLQNAADALTVHSGPKVRIATEVGDTIRIEIADNGPGIAPEIADDLFTPFVTGHSDGLGLGLGIARDIAREFGGSVDVIPSTLGGAAFRVELVRA